MKRFKLTYTNGCLPFIYNVEAESLEEAKEIAELEDQDEKFLDFIGYEEEDHEEIGV